MSNDLIVQYVEETHSLDQNILKNTQLLYNIFSVPL